MRGGDTWLNESLENAQDSAEWADVADAVLVEVRRQLRDFHVGYFSDLTAREQAFVMRRAEEAVRSTRPFEAFERRLDRTLEESLVRVVREKNSARSAGADEESSRDDIVVACDAAASAMVSLLRELPEERRAIVRLFNAPLDNAVLREQVWSLHLAAPKARRAHESRLARDRLSTISSMDVEITRSMRETLALHVPELAERAEIDMRLFMAMSAAFSYEHAERQRAQQARPSDAPSSDALPVEPRHILALVPILLVFRAPIAQNGAVEVFERLSALKARMVPRPALVGLVAQLLEAHDEPLLRALRAATAAESSRTTVDVLLGEHLERGFVGLLACDVSSAAGGGAGAAHDTLLYVWDQCVQQHRPRPRAGFVDLGFGHFLAAAAAALLQCVRGELAQCTTREQCSAALRLAAAKIGVSRLRGMVRSSFGAHLETVLGLHLSAEAHLDFLHEDGEATDSYLASPRHSKKAGSAAASPDAVAALLRRLTAFYAEHAPKDIRKAASLAKKYVGHEESLFTALAKKYGADPRDVVLSEDEEHIDAAGAAAEGGIHRDVESGAAAKSERDRDPRKSLASGDRALDVDLEDARRRHLPRYASVGGGADNLARRTRPSTLAYGSIQKAPAQLSATVIAAWPPLQAQKLRVRCATAGTAKVLEELVSTLAAHNTMDPSPALEELIVRELPFFATGRHEETRDAALRAAPVAPSSKAAEVVSTTSPAPAPRETESESEQMVSESEMESDSEDEDEAEKAEATAALQKLLTRFYTKHAPAQLSRVPSLARKYVGNETTLYAALQKKYGTDPAEEAPAPAPTPAPADSVNNWLLDQGFSSKRATELSKALGESGVETVDDLKELEADDYTTLGITAAEQKMLDSSHAMDELSAPTNSPGKKKVVVSTTETATIPPVVVAPPFEAAVKLVKSRISTQACTLVLFDAEEEGKLTLFAAPGRNKELHSWSITAGLTTATAKHAKRFDVHGLATGKSKTKPKVVTLEAKDAAERDAWLDRIRTAAENSECQPQSS